MAVGEGGGGGGGGGVGGGLGSVRFMPFKQHGGDAFDYELLVGVFSMLPLQMVGTLARVCKRWRSVASDPSWMPELLAYAWGGEQFSGLAADCARPTLLPFSHQMRVRQLVCADNATFALTVEGDVYHWGASWMGEVVPNQSEPARLPELSDVSCVACTPSGVERPPTHPPLFTGVKTIPLHTHHHHHLPFSTGYFHGRAGIPGYSCAAVARDGRLYTWGRNEARQLLHTEQAHASHVERPTRAPLDGGRHVRLAACGVHFTALCYLGPGDAAPAGERVSCVATVGVFAPRSSRAHNLCEWPQLRGVPLRQLEAGGFHCVALTTRGEVWTFGDQRGAWPVAPPSYGRCSITRARACMQSTHLPIWQVPTSRMATCSATALPATASTTTARRPSCR